ncbi:MAG: GerMN domain-containing protein [Deltaproteobacteria bacterium]|nr:GerMN domain-containing protein [Deltaproteobacteria bacterium]
MRTKSAKRSIPCKKADPPSPAPHPACGRAGTPQKKGSFKFFLVLSLLFLLACPPAQARVEDWSQLYFADPSSGYLKPERRVVARGEGAAAYAKNLVEALLAGPAAGGAGILPQGTRLLALFVTPDGTAWVDFSGEFVGNMAAAWAEALALYGVSSTLCLNVETIARVRFLVEGAEIQAARHLSLDRAYMENLRLIR